MIEEMLAYNREFVRSKGYEKFQTSKFPDKKIAILTCMDTRLVELLPAALGIRNGDVANRMRFYIRDNKAWSVMVGSRVWERIED